MVCGLHRWLGKWSVTTLWQNCKWEIDGTWYGLTPAKGNPCLWAVVQLLAEEGPATKAGRQGAKPITARSIGVQTEGQDKPLDLLGGVVT